MEIGLFYFLYFNVSLSIFCVFLCASDSLATYGAIEMCFDWLIDWLWATLPETNLNLIEFKLFIHHEMTQYMNTKYNDIYTKSKHN